MIAEFYHRLLPVAQRTLPQSVKVRMAPLLRFAESVTKASVERRFESRPRPLREWSPLLSREAFTRGPIIIANEALGPGGAERQITYTFLGIASLVSCPVQVLCTRLGERRQHGFFLDALVNYPNAARDAVDLQEARRRMHQRVGEDASAQIEKVLAWIPAPVRADVIRYVSEFVEIRPCVVHGWQDYPGLAAAIAARIVGVPRIVVSGRNLAPPNFPYFRNYMLPAYREIASCREIMLTNNSAAGAADYATWIGIPEEQIIVIRNGLAEAPRIGHAATRTASWRQRLNFSPDAPIVGSMFRFYDEKRPFLWIEVAALIAQQRPDVHFVIFGDGPHKRRMGALARQRGLAERFHMPGISSNAEDAMNLFDVFLLTSRFEGVPNVLLEAASLGIPVVTTDAGGAREAVLEGQTGLVATDHSPAAIAELVVGILSDPTWRNRAAQAAPHFLRDRFGHDRMIAETLRLYGMQVSADSNP